MNRRLLFRLIYQAARIIEGTDLDPKLERIARKFDPSELRDLAGELTNWATVVAQPEWKLPSIRAELQSRGVAQMDQPTRARVAALLQHWAAQLTGAAPLTKPRRNRLNDYISSKYIDLN